MKDIGFSGSYNEEEVCFLLRRISMDTTPLEQREELIQSGRKHYSEMIGPEDAPSRERIKLFKECLQFNGSLMARDIAILAKAMVKSTEHGEIVIVSIARAGTPVGVLLWHRLRNIAPELKITHYSISVIRDKGVDQAALKLILARHPAASLRFVDGWTGKGTIATELALSISAWKQAPKDLDPGLWVPLDVCCAAAFSSSSKDYLIPSALLGGTISGLVSRSVLLCGEEGQFHACVQLNHLKHLDLSRWFIRKLNAEIEEIPFDVAASETVGFSACTRDQTRNFLSEVMLRHNVSDVNRVKLGIGETIRVLMRRKPKMVYLHPDASNFDASIIRRLAKLRGVSVETSSDSPFLAFALIASVQTTKNKC
jgi:hypothetical protein